MITYYIEDLVFNRAENSPFISKIRISYSNKDKKTVLLVSNGIPSNYIDFFKENSINLDRNYSTNDSIFLTNKLTDIKEKDVRDIFVIDDKTEITATSLRKMREKFHVHYLTSVSNGGSRILNYVSSNDMLIVKKSCFLNIHFALGIAGLYPNHSEAINNFSSRTTTFEDLNTYLLITENKSIKTLQADTNIIEEYKNVPGDFKVQGETLPQSNENYLTELQELRKEIRIIKDMLKEKEDENNDPLRYFRRE